MLAGLLLASTALPMKFTILDLKATSFRLINSKRPGGRIY